MNTYFRTDDVVPVRVCLPGGQVAVVTDQERPLDPMFHRQARSMGLLWREEDQKATDVVKPTYTPGSDPALRQGELVAAILGAINGSEAGFLTNAGIPGVNKLAEKAGFLPTALERDAAWVEAQKILDADDAANGVAKE